jgi:phosphoribosyl-AMP cyclohydrolase
MVTCCCCPIEQVGGIACHTGPRKLLLPQVGWEERWVAADPVLKDPRDIYGK